VEGAFFGANAATLNKSECKGRLGKFLAWSKKLTKSILMPMRALAVAEVLRRFVTALLPSRNVIAM